MMVGLAAVFPQSRACSDAAPVGDSAEPAGPSGRNLTVLLMSFETERIALGIRHASTNLGVAPITLQQVTNTNIQDYIDQGHQHQHGKRGNQHVEVPCDATDQKSEHHNPHAQSLGKILSTVQLVASAKWTRQQPPVIHGGHYRYFSSTTITA
jgi:hypothetical protein